MRHVGHDNVIDAVLHRYCGRNAVIGTEDFQNDTAVNEVSSDEDSQTDKETYHEIAPSSCIARLFSCRQDDMSDYIFDVLLLIGDVNSGHVPILKICMVII